MFQFNNSASGLKIDIKVKRLDATNSTEFKNELSTNCQGDLRNVEVDLSEIEFIDSSGIGALLSIQKRLKNDSEPVTLINPKPAVLSIIELLRLHRVFKLQNS